VGLITDGSLKFIVYRHMKLDDWMKSVPCPVQKSGNVSLFN